MAATNGIAGWFREHHCRARYWVATLLLVAISVGDGQPLHGQETKGDEKLANEIRQRFAQSRIGQNGFEVEVSNGIVTLTGQTPVSQHKGTATRLARLAGAREVINEITVTGSGPPAASRAAATAQAKRSDRHAAIGKVAETSAATEAAISAAEVSRDASGEQPTEEDESVQLSEATGVPEFRVTKPAPDAKHRRRSKRY